MGEPDFFEDAHRLQSEIVQFLHSTDRGEKAEKFENACRIGVTHRDRRREIGEEQISFHELLETTLSSSGPMEVHTGVHLRFPDWDVDHQELSLRFAQSMATDMAAEILVVNDVNSQVVELASFYRECYYFALRKAFCVPDRVSQFFTVEDEDLSTFGATRPDQKIFTQEGYTTGIPNSPSDFANILRTKGGFNPKRTDIVHGGLVGRCHSVAAKILFTTKSLLLPFIPAEGDEGKTQKELYEILVLGLSLYARDMGNVSPMEAGVGWDSVLRAQHMGGLTTPFDKLFYMQPKANVFPHPNPFERLKKLHEFIIRAYKK